MACEEDVGRGDTADSDVGSESTTLQICHIVMFLQYYNSAGRSSLNKQYSNRALSHTGQLGVDITCRVIHLLRGESDGHAT